jgi:hypothetical protein
MLTYAKLGIITQDLVSAATMGGPKKPPTFTTMFELRNPKFTTRWHELPTVR